MPRKLSLFNRLRRWNSSTAEDELPPDFAKKKSILRQISMRQTGEITINFDLALHKGEVLKLKGDGHWSKVGLTMTSQVLAFTELTHESHIMDAVPLHDVTLVCHRFSQADVESVAPRKFSSRDSSGSFHQLFSRLTSGSSSRGAKMSLGSAPDEHVNTDFEVHTVRGGFNSGRVYAIRCETEEECSTWIENLRKFAVLAYKDYVQQTKIEEWKQRARIFYKSWVSQMFFTCLIAVNFCINAAEAQINSDARDIEELFDLFDKIITALFTAELALNAFGHWFWPFVSNGWSLFDAAVVCASIVALTVETVVQLNVLRLLRAFRILRIIGRFEKLRRISNAILVSVVPVLNVLFLGAVVVMIYAVIGVYIFSDQAESFENFAKAVFTLFVVAGLGEWPDELPAFSTENYMDWNVVIFLFTYVAIILWTILQVIVAVLLDGFTTATMEDKMAKAMKKQKQMRTVTHALDPLLEELSGHFDDYNDLNQRIRLIFQILDPDRSGKIGYTQMSEGLKKLDLRGSMQIHISKGDFQLITDNLTLCDEHGEISRETFDLIMRNQLAAYVQRRLADANAFSFVAPETRAIIASLKMIIASMRMQEKQDNMAKSETRKQFESLDDTVFSMSQDIALIKSQMSTILEAVAPNKKTIAEAGAPGDRSSLSSRGSRGSKGNLRVQTESLWLEDDSKGTPTPSSDHPQSRSKPRTPVSLITDRRPSPGDQQQPGTTSLRRNTVQFLATRDRSLRTDPAPPLLRRMSESDLGSLHGGSSGNVFAAIDQAEMADLQGLDVHGGTAELGKLDPSGTTGFTGDVDNHFRAVFAAHSNHTSEAFNLSVVQTPVRQTMDENRTDTPTKIFVDGDSAPLDLGTVAHISNETRSPPLLPSPSMIDTDPATVFHESRPAIASTANVEISMRPSGSSPSSRLPSFLKNLPSDPSSVGAQLSTGRLRKQQTPPGFRNAKDLLEGSRDAGEDRTNGSSLSPARELQFSSRRWP